MSGKRSTSLRKKKEKPLKSLNTFESKTALEIKSQKSGCSEGKYKEMWIGDV